MFTKMTVGIFTVKFKVCIEDMIEGKVLMGILMKKLLLLYSK